MTKLIPPCHRPGETSIPLGKYWQKNRPKWEICPKISTPLGNCHMILSQLESKWEKKFTKKGEVVEKFSNFFPQVCEVMGMSEPKIEKRPFLRDKILINLGPLERLFSKFCQVFSRFWLIFTKFWSKFLEIVTL